MLPTSPRNLLLHLTCLLNLAITNVQSLQISNDSTTIQNQTFDYIIVGGGTAGLTIANRLTEDQRTTVLVIESGNDLQNDTRITDPGMFALADISDISWKYSTTNQTIGGKQQVINAGKVLGGSSAINGMQWTRGTVGQYDALEELGNEGWNFNTLQKYMIKAEKFHVPDANQTSLGVAFDAAAHGTKGKIDSGFPNPYTCPSCKLWDALVNSTAQVFPGIRADETVDQCSGDPQGVARCSFSITPGTSDGATQNVRSSSAHGYVYSLTPVQRPNLSILTGHLATKIVWKAKALSEPPTPEGVAFEIPTSSSQSFVARVAKEVIVTCGSIGSPKFLELSGIGDRKLLESFNISAVVDLPSVGTNLQDQANIVTEFTATDILNSSIGHAPAGGAAAFVTLSQLLGPDAAADYVQSLQSTISTRAKSIVSSGAAVSVNGMEKMLTIQAREMGQESAPVVEFDYLFLPGTGLVGSSSWILLPQSRGTVHIVSSDPRVPPTVNPNYLAVPQDFSLLVNTSIALRRIFTAPAIQQFVGSEIIPGADVQSDEEFVNFVTNNFAAVLHPIGSLSMLPKDLGGAVDSKLRVYGVRGVRVADASVLPIQISAHLSSTVYGIAEKAADLIRGL
ncbi:hypothetical protein BDQ17DRAFT_1357062 [Cyathus striatus]|nr:hypothetical protein BDQ17DRAFT_1357062 [Cyathus striatus]